MKLQNIINYLEHFAPISWQEDWDNAGLQLGDNDQDIKKIVLALDADDRALEYCKQTGADLLITHHPLIFNSLKSINYQIPEEKIIAEFICNHISVYSMHTNVDKVPWGTNYALAKELGLENSLVEEPLLPEYSKEFNVLTPEFKGQFNQKVTGFVSIAEPENLSRTELLDKCKEAFKLEPAVNFSKLKFGEKIEKLAISGGSFDKEWIDKLYKNNVDTLVTGEMKYHDQVLCRERGIAVVVLGHGVSENPVLNTFYYVLELLQNSLKNSDDETEKQEELEVEFFVA